MIFRADSAGARSLLRSAYPIWALALLVLSTSASASRLATVDVENVEVYESPKKGSKVIGTLKKDTHVLASNYPTENFHKIKTKDDLKGWVLADTLVLKEIPAGAPERALAGDEKPRNDSGEVQEKRKGPHDPSFRLRALGGLNFYNATGIVTNFDNLTLGYSFGGEFHFILNRGLSLGFRGESLFSTATLTDSASGSVFRIGLGSIPIQAGLEATLVDEDKLAIHLAAYGGYALMTQVTSTNVTGGTSVSVGSGALSALGKIDIHLKFSRSISFFIEGGYRFLQTGSLTAPTSSTASAILNSTFTVNLTGPFAGAGLNFNF